MTTRPRGRQARRTQLDVLTRRVEATEAVLEIQALKARYGELVDRRFARGGVVDDADLTVITAEIAGLFTEDASWDGGPVLGVAIGRDAIAARLRSPTLTFSRHLFVQPQIEVSGDHATARWQLLCPCRSADGSSLWMSGFEDDEYLRGEDRRWLHRSMRLTTVFVSPVGAGWDRILV